MTNPVSYVGHPDFIPTNSNPGPTFVKTSASKPAGAWGPDTYNLTSGGAYMIAVTGVTANEIGFTDITVQHYDFLGNLVWTDFFGAVMVGANTLLPVSANGPTILRGNIYGSVIKISGFTGNSGFLNGVLGTSGFTATSIQYSLYILPSGIGDPDPKMSNGSVTFLSTSVPTPGGLLGFFTNETLTAGTATTINPLVPYAGPAIVGLEVGGALTVPADLTLFIRHWTVQNTATQFCQELIQPIAVNQGNTYPINIPACLTTIEATNAHATQSALINITVTAERTA